ncbi:hypothetical protein PInf_017646 [Phytophthora infestans]|nr:hypothetical protein PInf_017646 [Phytophthora infestans]
MSKRRFKAILAENDRENDKRIEHFYNPGDNVVLRIPKAFRSMTRAAVHGPYTIKLVHTNSTVTIAKGSWGEYDMTACLI